MTRLERLNEQLAKYGDLLSIPDFRRHVSPAGSNLNWLKSRIATVQACPAELRELIDMSTTSNLNRP